MKVFEGGFGVGRVDGHDWEGRRVEFSPGCFFFGARASHLIMKEPAGEWMSVAEDGINKFSRVFMVA